MLSSNNNNNNNDNDNNQHINMFNNNCDCDCEYAASSSYPLDGGTDDNDEDVVCYSNDNGNVNNVNGNSIEHSLLSQQQQQPQHQQQRQYKRIRRRSTTVVFAVLLIMTSSLSSSIRMVEARAAASSSSSWFGRNKSTSSSSMKLFPTTTTSPATTTTTTATAKKQQQQQQQKNTPSMMAGTYRWGNFGYHPHTVPRARILRDKLRRFVATAIEQIGDEASAARRRFTTKHFKTPGRAFQLVLRLVRSYAFWFFSKDCLASIYEDRWHAERDPDGFFGSGGMWISTGTHKDVVRKRMQRSKRNRQWVGLGYTPRLVWLVGVLLRGTFQCTSIPKIFDPGLASWGAGTVLGAKCTHQEWIASFMLGWFGSEYYWKFLFGCNGPPFKSNGKNSSGNDNDNDNGDGDEFNGVPISITKIRIL